MQPRTTKCHSQLGAQMLESDLCLDLSGHYSIYRCFQLANFRARVSRYSASNPVQMWAGTPTTCSSCSAISREIVSSPSKRATIFDAGRSICDANDSLVIPKYSSTSSKSSPGGMARSEQIAFSAVIMFADFLNACFGRRTARLSYSRPRIHCAASAWSSLVLLCPLVGVTRSIRRASCPFWSAAAVTLRANAMA